MQGRWSGRFCRSLTTGRSLSPRSRVLRRWRLSERMEVRSKVKRNCPDCKIILTVEERADKELAEQVKAAKRDGLIDAFIFLSMTDKYLTALLDTL